MKILLVEDHPTDIRLIRAIFDASGHQVAASNSAEDAMLNIEADPPDLILLDLKLSGMNGLTLARRIKQNPATRHISIVAITAAWEEFRREDALDAGCDAFLLKPVDTRKLTEQVAKIAGKVG